MNKIYIAIIGKIAAGKGTFGLMLQEELGVDIEVSFLRFSDPLNEALDALGLERSRQNQQWLSTETRKRHGEDTLGMALLKRSEADSADIVFFDGVRRPQDVAMIQKLSRGFLIEVFAPAEKRYERLVKRADRPGDAEKTWERFCEEENAETEQLIDVIAKSADIRIDNSDTVHFLRLQVKTFITDRGWSKLVQ